MAIQPNIHYDGPLTQEYIQDLLDKLSVALTDVREFKPTDLPDNLSQPEWIWCQANWIDTLQYAGLRCASISTKMPFTELNDDDRKCIDITLCILRDFAEAKSLKFLKKI